MFVSVYVMVVCRCALLWCVCLFLYNIWSVVVWVWWEDDEEEDEEGVCVTTVMTVMYQGVKVVSKIIRIDKAKQNFRFVSFRSRRVSY